MSSKCIHKVYQIWINLCVSPLEGCRFTLRRMSSERTIGPNLAGGWPEVVYNAPKLARFGISVRDGCFPTPKNLPNHRPSTPVGSAETHNTPHRPNSRFWRHTGARGPRRLLKKV